MHARVLSLFPSVSPLLLHIFKVWNSNRILSTDFSALPLISLSLSLSLKQIFNEIQPVVYSNFALFCAADQKANGEKWCTSGKVCLPYQPTCCFHSTSIFERNSVGVWQSLRLCHYNPTTIWNTFQIYLHFLLKRYFLFYDFFFCFLLFLFFSPTV